MHAFNPVRLCGRTESCLWSLPEHVQSRAVLGIKGSSTCWVAVTEFSFPQRHILALNFYIERRSSSYLTPHSLVDLHGRYIKHCSILSRCVPLDTLLARACPLVCFQTTACLRIAQASWSARTALAASCVHHLPDRHILPDARSR